MNTTWKWILGIALALSLIVLPFFWRPSTPYGGDFMMGTGYGWHIPMMYSGYGMMGFGMFFMWLTQLGLLVLIGLGIAMLVRQLKLGRQ